MLATTPRVTVTDAVFRCSGASAEATWDIANDLYMSGSTNVTSASGSQNAGSSTLNVDKNGVVTVGGTLYLKDRGTINLNGGELAADNIVFLDFTGTNYDPVPTVNFNSGTLRYTNSVEKSLSATDLGIIFGGSEQTLNAGQHLDVAGVILLGSDIKVDGGTFSFGTMDTTEFAKIEFDSGTLNVTGSSVVVTNSGLFGSTLVIDEDEAINVTGNTFVQSDGLLNVADDLPPETRSKCCEIKSRI